MNFFSDDVFFFKYFWGFLEFFMANNLVFGFSSITTFLLHTYWNALLYKITFIYKKILFKKSWNGKKKIHLFMYFDKKKIIIRHLFEKSFSVFNSVWRRPIEHNKTFSGQMFYYLFFKVHDKCIFYHFKICLTKFSWSCQKRWFCILKNLNMCATRMFFLMTIRKQGFQA